MLNSPSVVNLIERPGLNVPASSSSGLPVSARLLETLRQARQLTQRALLMYRVGVGPVLDAHQGLGFLLVEAPVMDCWLRL